MSVKLFDASFYRAANSDLQGLSDAQAWSHFQNYGLNEGRAFSPFVDLNFYRASNGDLASFSNRQAYEHLQNYGVREGRKFSPFFDLNFYQRHNGDLTSFNNEQLEEHLRSWGVAEGRRFSPLVDLNLYRSVNGDLASFNNNQALQHLEIYGLSEGRRFSPFVDLNLYAAANPDLAKMGWNNIQLVRHLANSGVAEGRRFSVSFDSNYYRSTYSDLAGSGLSNTQLLEHFEDYGLAEGRASSESFNVKYYLDNNSDLRAFHFNNQQAEQHFEIYGFHEGRLGTLLGQISLPKHPGNTINSPFSFGVINGSRSIREFVGSNNSDDCYCFTLGNISNFSLTLNGLGSNGDVQLLDGNGNTMTTGSYNYGTKDETIGLQLNPGTYYIKVYPNSRVGSVNTNYNLTVSATPTPPSSLVFNSTYGYGLVDAGAAVARAIGQSAFANTAKLGGNNWGDDLVHAPEAWARGFTGQGITVAVIDDGVDINHEDLRGNIWHNPKEIANNRIDDDRNGYEDDINGWNFTLNNNNVMPSGIHGTHVSGLIAARNNGLGVTGVAYNAKIMPIRISDNQDSLIGDLVGAIHYAVDNGARVINMSLSCSYFPELQDALAYAASHNVITVSAAGNYSQPTPTTPASYATQYGISVGAVDKYGTIAKFSNRAGNDSRMRYVVAPGVDIFSTTPDNTYEYHDGTSMATPYVAGVVALMLSANPSLTPTQVRDMIASSAIHTTYI